MTTMYKTLKVLWLQKYQFATFRVSMDTSLLLDTCQGILWLPHACIPLQMWTVELAAMVHVLAIGFHLLLSISQIWLLEHFYVCLFVFMSVGWDAIWCSVLRITPLTRKSSSKSSSQELPEKISKTDLQ